MAPKLFTGFWRQSALKLPFASRLPISMVPVG